MILRLAVKSLLLHPVRAAVLGVGFGLGVGVMATLLGVGEVVLDQAKAPALAGGGDVVISALSGPVTSARFVLNRIQQQVVTASPRRRAELYLLRPGKDPLPVQARGGIPSLERALGDRETSGIAAWRDTPADEAWSSPKPDDVLRAMDRFHPLPDVPERASSWAEWLYFKGSNRDQHLTFYLTFLVGPRQSDGSRAAGVRLQLDRDGEVTTYSDGQSIDEDALLAAAPDITIGRSRVRLEGLHYRITLDLPASDASASRTTGEIVIDAVAGRSLPPLVIRGARGWVSGYTVPVMSGTLAGWIAAGGSRLALDGTGYHDHNWGFWEGVSWRWGQVQHGDQSYVYGRVYPPADAADPERIPGFLVALGPDGPVGYSTRVTIRETDDAATGQPRRIIVESQGGSLDLLMTIDVDAAIVTRGGALARGPDFLQLRARYHVTGTAGGRAVDFTAPGAAETFRGRR